MTASEREEQIADGRIQQHATLDSVGAGNGYRVRGNLQKLIGEYARHNGQAGPDPRADRGQTGE